MTKRTRFASSSFPVTSVNPSDRQTARPSARNDCTRAALPLFGASIPNGYQDLAVLQNKLPSRRVRLRSWELRGAVMTWVARLRSTANCRLDSRVRKSLTYSDSGRGKGTIKTAPGRARTSSATSRSAPSAREESRANCPPRIRCSMWASAASTPARTRPYSARNLWPVTPITIFDADSKLRLLICSPPAD